VLDVNFTVDYDTDAANPSVELRTGSLSWNVRSDDDGSPARAGFERGPKRHSKELQTGRPRLGGEFQGEDTECGPTTNCTAPLTAS
jgi:hypothetical protein